MLLLDRRCGESRAFKNAARFLGEDALCDMNLEWSSCHYGCVVAYFNARMSPPVFWCFFQARSTNRSVFGSDEARAPDWVEAGIRAIFRKQPVSPKHCFSFLFL